MVYKTKYGLAQKCDRREKKDGPRNRYIKKTKGGKSIWKLRSIVFRMRI